MFNFCTLFNSNYLSRGLALYESLLKHCPSFKLYVLAMDDRCYETLEFLNLPSIILINLKDFEDESLLLLKKHRTVGEYCWTCTPSIIKYCLTNFNLPLCTYLDADIYFFESPRPLLEELGSSSVLITEHWYTPEYDQVETSGRFCVQFMTFKNSIEGLEVLEWWRLKCNEWCFARHENGKFGDQKYLDCWPEKFPQVFILQNRGAGVAPWNIQQYDLLEGTSFLFEKGTFQTIFYHFHGLKLFNDLTIDLGNYRLSKKAIKSIYIPYIQHLFEIERKLLGLNITFNCHNYLDSPRIVNRIYAKIKGIIKRNYNVFKSGELLS